jgi:hypothetical protein
MVMTQQYLAGELSVLLAGLQSVVGDQATVRDLGLLRREAETRPVTALGPIVAQALTLMDTVCLASLTNGDLAAFHRQCVTAAELYQFGVCAGLLAER